MERSNTGCTVKDVPAAEFVTTYAAHLKRVGHLEIPPWVDTIKTAPRKELAPYDPDWLYIRIGKCHTHLSISLLALSLFLSIYLPKSNMKNKRTINSVHCAQTVHPRRYWDGRVPEDLWRPQETWHEAITQFEGVWRSHSLRPATARGSRRRGEGRRWSSSPHNQGSS